MRPIYWSLHCQGNDIMMNETRRKCWRVGSSQIPSSSPLRTRSGHSRSSPASMIFAILVIRWKEVVKRGGREALAAKPHPGRHPHLSPEQKRKPLELLSKGPTAHGYVSQLWTLPRIAKVIEHHFSIKYNPAHIWKILHTCGWSCQKLERRVKEGDEAQIRNGHEERCPHIKKTLKSWAKYSLSGWERIHAPPSCTTDMGTPRTDT